MSWLVNINTNYVYKVTNMVTGHCYYGSKLYPDKIGNKLIIGESYFTSSKSKNSIAEWFRVSFSKDSPVLTNWKIEILYQNEDYNKVLEVEDSLIKGAGLYNQEKNPLSLNFHHRDKFYNSPGYKLTEEQRQKISIIQTNRERQPHSKETK